MLRKLVDISLKKNHSSYIQSPPKLRSNSFVNRIRDIERINYENRALTKRIIESKASVKKS